MRVIERFSAGAALFLSGGCVPFGSQSGEPVAGEATGSVTVLNGLHLNGLHLNGLHLNGLHLDGAALVGAATNGLQANGPTIENVRLAGARIVATLTGGAQITPSALVGATLPASLSDGSAITLRIDAIMPGAAPDMLRYAVSWAPLGSDAFAPLCGAVGGAPRLAIPLAGAWDESVATTTGGSRLDDPRAFTFACEGHALAKCVELGYAPWRRVTECRSPTNCRLHSLAPLHQACTRLLRADYCGDGTSATRDGTAVDLWDALGVELDETPSWPFEAEWSVDGASCVMATRWATLAHDDRPVRSYIEQRCPERWRPDGCGGPGSTFFAANGFTLAPLARVLLRSRIAPDPQ